jgi:hypothetical protein
MSNIKIRFVGLSGHMRVSTGALEEVASFAIDELAVTLGPTAPGDDTPPVVMTGASMTLREERIGTDAADEATVVNIDRLEIGDLTVLINEVAALLGYRRCCPQCEEDSTAAWVVGPNGETFPPEVDAVLRKLEGLHPLMRGVVELGMRDLMEAMSSPGVDEVMVPAFRGVPGLNSAEFLEAAQTDPAAAIVAVLGSQLFHDLIDALDEHFGRRLAPFLVHLGGFTMRVSDEHEPGPGGLGRYPAGTSMLHVEPEPEPVHMN